jgi:mRNA-degrading endonuclease RelE of RelBE toxin-antitoxin system
VDVGTADGVLWSGAGGHEGGEDVVSADLRRLRVGQYRMLDQIAGATREILITQTGRSG